METAIIVVIIGAIWAWIEAGKKKQEPTPVQTREPEPAKQPETSQAKQDTGTVSMPIEIFRQLVQGNSNQGGQIQGDRVVYVLPNQGNQGNQHYQGNGNQHIQPGYNNNQVQGRTVYDQHGNPMFMIPNNPGNNGNGNGGNHHGY